MITRAPHAGEVRRRMVKGSPLVTIADAVRLTPARRRVTPSSAASADTSRHGAAPLLRISRLHDDIRPRVYADVREVRLPLSINQAHARVRRRLSHRSTRYPQCRRPHPGRRLATSFLSCRWLRRCR